MDKVFSAGAVVFRVDENHEREYLLLKYEKGHRGFPKGWIEENETPEESARREIEEETGIKKIEFLEGFKEMINFYYTREGKRIYKEVVYFVAYTSEKEVELSEEHKDFEWLNYEDAYKRLTYKNTKEILEKAYHFINQTFPSEDG